MKVREFALVADENIHPTVVEHLRDEGMDVLDVKENGLVGMPDIELIRLARSQDRVILTHDRDFGRLAIAMMEPMVGIIYLRPGHIDPGFTNDSIRALLQESLDVTVPFIIVAVRKAGQVKIRLRCY